MKYKLLIYFTTKKERCQIKKVKRRKQTEKITTRIIKVNNGKNQSTYNHGIASKYIN